MRYRKTRCKFITKSIMDGFWKRMVQGAISRNIEVVITPEELEEIWQLQQGKCKYTNQTITLPQNIRELKQSLTNASVDRIDSKLPYTKDNVCFVSKTINLMKSNLSLDRFNELCSLVALFNQ